MKAKELVSLLNDEIVLSAWNAHQKHSTKPSGATRRIDGCTPYAVHPVGCAMLVLAESSLPHQLRYAGALALLFHDVVEDTIAPIPPELPVEVVELVHELTFPGGSTQEMQEIWDRSLTARMLKCYDKWWNLADGFHTWMSERGKTYQDKYLEYSIRLADNVDEHLDELIRPDAPRFLHILGMIKHFSK